MAGQKSSGKEKEGVLRGHPRQPSSPVTVGDGESSVSSLSEPVEYEEFEGFGSDDDASGIDEAGSVGNQQLRRRSPQPMRAARARSAMVIDDTGNEWDDGEEEEYESSSSSSSEDDNEMLLEESEEEEEGLATLPPVEYDDDFTMESSSAQLRPRKRAASGPAQDSSSSDLRRHSAKRIILRTPSERERLAEEHQRRTPVIVVDAPINDSDSSSAEEAIDSTVNGFSTRLFERQARARARDESPEPAQVTVWDKLLAEKRQQANPSSPDYEIDHKIEFMNEKGQIWRRRTALDGAVSFEWINKGQFVESTLPQFDRPDPPVTP